MYKSIWPWVFMCLLFRRDLGFQNITIRCFKINFNLKGFAFFIHRVGCFHAFPCVKVKVFKQRKLPAHIINNSWGNYPITLFYFDHMMVMIPGVDTLISPRTGSKLDQNKTTHAYEVSFPNHYTRTGPDFNELSVCSSPRLRFATARGWNLVQFSDLKYFLIIRLV